MATTAITKKSVPLLKGDDGVVQTLLKMEALALRDAKASQIKAKVRELKGKNDTETIRNIYNFVVANWKYKSDPQTEEHVTAPIHILNNCDRFFGCKHVDCDDYTTFLAALLIAAGFKVAFRVLSWRAKSFTHVYLIAYLPEQNAWTPIDAVMGKTGLYNEKDRDAHLRTLTLPVGDVMNMLAQQTSMAEAYETLMDAAADAKKKDSYQLKTDVGAMAGRLVSSLGFPPNLENMKAQLKKEVVQMCEVETDGYISSQLWKIAAGGVGCLLVGGIIGYYVGKK